MFRNVLWHSQPYKLKIKSLYSNTHLNQIEQSTSLSLKYPCCSSRCSRIFHRRTTYAKQHAPNKRVQLIPHPKVAVRKRSLWYCNLPAGECFRQIFPSSLFIPVGHVCLTFFPLKFSASFPKLGIRKYSTDNILVKMSFFTTLVAGNKTCFSVETFLTYYLF